ncbi:MAG: tetratricopeptide repeat protein [Alphaproteobacteria bacterium]|nr:tetratricopeptide repeat protein [Alphaproteobacteria bacterium]
MKQIGLITSLIAAALASCPASASDKIQCSSAVSKSSEAACTRIILKLSNPAADRFMAFYNRAWYHRRSGAYDLAVADFNAAEALNKDFAKLYLSRALVKRETGDLDGALADLDTYTALDNNNWTGYYQRALILRLKGLPEDALGPLKKAQDLKPYERRLKALRVLVLSDLRHDASATKEADKLVAGRRSDPIGRYARAVVNFRQGEYDRALKDLKAAIRKQALFPAAHALRGQILEIRRRTDAAKSAYRRALKSAGPTIDQNTSQDLARRRLETLDSGRSGRLALRTQSDSPFGRSNKRNAKKKNQKRECRRYIPSAAVTVSVPCSN